MKPSYKTRLAIVFVLFAILSVPIIGSAQQTPAADSLAVQAVAPESRPDIFTSFTVQDIPYDAGRELELVWQLAQAPGAYQEVRIYRREGEQGEWTQVGAVPPTTSDFTDTKLKNGKPYGYLLRAFGTGFIYESQPVVNAICRASWFDMRKINLLVIAVLVLATIIFFVVRSGKKELFIRRIAGLQAVEEAVGRATEMGRSVLFVPGIQDLDDVQTIAGLTILESVAKLTAQYETKLDVPVARSLVMSNGREVVKQAYLSVGRPDFYHDDIVHYVTDEQFGYVAAVDGIMVRERPAACFFMGGFFAESLILAETGNHVGAIQIAGTAMPTQLPFFVAACDYTLIGEELFAASAYLSKDKRMIGSLRGQDMGKLLAMGSIIFGATVMTVASLTGSGFWSDLTTKFVRLFALNY